MLLPALSLCQRELVRFLRQRNRVIGALLTPIVFWLLIGGGMGRSFSAPGAGAGAGAGDGRGYIYYFFPGTVLMILLFTAIFSTISVIEDRREGFLQSVLVAPVSRLAVVLGKVLGGTVLAVGQALVFLLLAPLAGVRFTLPGAALALLVMVLVAFALTCLALTIAWRMSSTQGFHAIMNLLLMPMWFMSGALFPASGAWTGLRCVMLANPLTYGLAALRRAIDPESAGALGFPGLGVSLLVTIGFAAVMFVLAARAARSTVAADLQ